MIYLTMVARVIDGLPLSASAEEETGAVDLTKYRQEAKALFKKLSDTDGPQRCSLETNGFIFHYYIERGVVYLCLTELRYPKKQVYEYLQVLQQEFNSQYGSTVDTADRPWSFMSFQTFIDKTKKNYRDGRTPNNLALLNTELADVSRIMVKNIEDVIGRGERLEKMSDLAGQLAADSKKYLKDAKYINQLALLRKYAPLVVLLLTFIAIMYLRLYWY